MGGGKKRKEALKDKCFGGSGNKNISLQVIKFSVHMSFLKRYN